MSKPRVELNWQFQIDNQHICPLSLEPKQNKTSKRKTLNTGVESETRRARGDLKVEGDADSVGLELLHDLGERCIGLEDEALGADDGEVEPRALVERDAEELPRQVGVLLPRGPPRAVPGHGAVEEYGGLPSPVLGAAEGLRAATRLWEDLAVDRRPGARVPVHQPARRKPRVWGWAGGERRKFAMWVYGTTWRGAWRRLGGAPASATTRGEGLWRPGPVQVLVGRLAVGGRGRYSIILTKKSNFIP